VNTQFNHWTKRVVSTQVVTKNPILPPWQLGVAGSSPSSVYCFVLSTRRWGSLKMRPPVALGSEASPELFAFITSVASSPGSPPPHLLDRHRKFVGCSARSCPRPLGFGRSCHHTVNLPRTSGMNTRWFFVGSFPNHEPVGRGPSLKNNPNFGENLGLSFRGGPLPPFKKSRLLFRGSPLPPGS